MAAKKQSTVGQVTGAVKGAASAVVTAANEHVVQPVGHALGLTDEKKKKKPAAKKVAAKSVAHATAKKAPAKKAPAKKAAAKKSTAKKK